MTFNHRNPEQDCHSCDYLSHQIKSDGYIEPPNMATVWFRLPEFVTDPASNQLSASRFVLFMMGVLTVLVSIYLTFTGRANEVTTLIAAVAATAAGVYFGSQFKDLRWKRWWNREGE